MAKTIVIQTEVPVIPIKIGEVELSFPIDDESIKNFQQALPDFYKELEQLEAEGGGIEEGKKALEKTYDIIFGEGSFKKVYAQTPSLNSCSNYFVQIAEGIKEELKERGLSSSKEQKVEHYLKNSGKKQKKKKG